MLARAHTHTHKQVVPGFGHAVLRKTGPTLHVPEGVCSETPPQRPDVQTSESVV